MGQSAARMIFVVGNSRSGTTMMGRVLGRNSLIHTFPELHYFKQQVTGEDVLQRPSWVESRALALLNRLLTSACEGLFVVVTPGRYDAESKHILAQTARHDPVSVYREFLLHETRRDGKSIPCEQTPRYLFSLDEILAAFPESRVINMVRDPRDVLISQMNKWKRRFLGAKSIPLREAIHSWANYHPYVIARLWAGCIRQARRFEQDPRVLTLRFEDLLSRPEEIIRSLTEFIGVPFEDEMLKVPQIGSSTGKVKPANMGINASRASGWRDGGGLGRGELEICEWVAREEMLDQGYALSGTGHLGLTAQLNLILLPFKLAIALPMNLTRTKNLMQTIRLRLLAGSPA